MYRHSDACSCAGLRFERFSDAGADRRTEGDYHSAAKSNLGGAGNVLKQLW